MCGTALIKKRTIIPKVMEPFTLNMSIFPKLIDFEKIKNDKSIETLKKRVAFAEQRKCPPLL